MIITLWLLSACTPAEIAFSPRQQPATFTDCCLVASDGVSLHKQQWLSNTPTAIVIAIHGFNDYSHSFTFMGKALSQQGISVIAYDQRGYGQNQHAGIWPGTENLVADAKDMVEVTHKQHPNTPLYLLGSSMGGAVIIELLQQHPHLPIQGAILNAPAIWGGQTMNCMARIGLWAAAHTMPAKRFTGEGLKIKATDNLDILNEMAGDPYIVKASRVDSVYGLAKLMDQAYEHKQILTHHPTLLLYGLKDEVVPPIPIYRLAKMLPEQNVQMYKEGYHMLLRDHQRANVFEDIASWIKARGVQ